MAKLRNTTLGTMIPEKVDNVSPGADGNVSLSAVRYASQSLTDSQKSQARTNIGATFSGPPGYGAWTVYGTYYGYPIFIVLNSNGGWEPMYYDESAGGWAPAGDAIYGRPNATTLVWTFDFSEVESSDDPATGTGQTYGTEFSATRASNWTSVSPWIPDPPQIPLENEGGAMGDPPSAPRWEEDMWGDPGHDCWIVDACQCVENEGGEYNWEYSPDEFSTDPVATSLQVTYVTYNYDAEVVHQDTVTWRRQVFKGVVLGKDTTPVLALQEDLDSHTHTKAQVGLMSVDNVSFRHSAGVFQSDVQYYNGDFCIRSNALYKFTTSHKGGWNSSHATKIVDLETAAPASGGTKLITNGQVYTALQNVGGGYAIVSPTVTISGTTASATLQDRAVNNISLASTITQLNLTFPAAVSGVSRDFFLRLTVTGTTPPEVSFAGSPTFDVDDDEWANVEPGVNILLFTETNQ